MPVLLTVSKTITGANVSDALAGGGTGLDFGNVANGAYAPIIDRSLNTGKQDLFIRHNAVIDPIINTKIYLDDYVATTAGTYGGVAGNQADLTALVALGNGSGSSKNNADGLSGGIWIDMDWLVTDANRFDQATRPVRVKIFGDNGTDGLDDLTAFTFHQDAMSFWNGVAEIDASTPVAGSIGRSTDTVLGNRAHFFSRWYLTAAYPDGGIAQAGLVIVYTFTA